MGWESGRGDLVGNHLPRTIKSYLYRKRKHSTWTGWPNRDLNVGAIIASAPTLKPFADLLGVDESAVRRVLLTGGQADTMPSSTRMANQHGPMAGPRRRCCRPHSVLLV
jgi:hypothetical protein